MNVIICGGGTVGHLTPAISIAEIITRSYKKSDLLSYKELREFCFSSIFPYIQKELKLVK